MPISAVLRSDLVISIYFYIVIYGFIYVFFFSYYLPSCSIPRDWIQLPVLYSRSSLLIPSKRHCVHLPTPDSPSVPPLLPPPWQPQVCSPWHINYSFLEFLIRWFHYPRRLWSCFWLCLFQWCFLPFVCLVAFPLWVDTSGRVSGTAVSGPWVMWGWGWGLGKSFSSPRLRWYHHVCLCLFMAFRGRGLEHLGVMPTFFRMTHAACFRGHWKGIFQGDFVGKAVLKGQLRTQCLWDAQGQTPYRYLVPQWIPELGKYIWNIHPLAVERGEWLLLWNEDSIVERKVQCFVWILMENQHSSGAMHPW